MIQVRISQDQAGVTGMGPSSLSWALLGCTFPGGFAQRGNPSAGHTVGQYEILLKGGFKCQRTLTLNKGCNVKCQERAFPGRKKAGADAQGSEWPMKGPIIMISRLWRTAPNV